MISRALLIVALCSFVAVSTQDVSAKGEKQKQAAQDPVHVVLINGVVAVVTFPVTLVTGGMTDSEKK